MGTGIEHCYRSVEKVILADRLALCSKLIRKGAILVGLTSKHLLGPPAVVIQGSRAAVCVVTYASTHFRDRLRRAPRSRGLPERTTTAPKSGPTPKRPDAVPRAPPPALPRSSLQSRGRTMCISVYVQRNMEEAAADWDGILITGGLKF